MSKIKLKRKEVWLTQDVIKKLEQKAKDDFRPLKSYMEKVLNDHVKDNESLNNHVSVH